MFRRDELTRSINGVSICSDDGLSPIRHQAIILTNAGLLSIRTIGTNFSEILIKIQNFSFSKVHLTISSVKWWPSCLVGDELTRAMKYDLQSQNSSYIFIIHICSCEAL